MNAPYVQVMKMPAQLSYINCVVLLAAANWDTGLGLAEKDGNCAQAQRHMQEAHQLENNNYFGAKKHPPKHHF